MWRIQVDVSAFHHPSPDEQRESMLAEFGNASEALLLYDMQLPITDLRVAEHFIVSGGQITRICQVHDTAALRAAGMGQQEAQ